ncbi:hypothetical protein ACVWYU_001827 [Pseudomonas sp. TE12234]
MHAACQAISKNQNKSKYLKNSGLFSWAETISGVEAVKIRWQKKTQSDQHEESSSGIFLIIVALIAGISGASGSAITAYTNQYAEKHSFSQACVARIDEQESRLREKAAVFLGNLARFIASTPNISIKDNAKLISVATDTGYQLAAYAPEELLKSTSLLLTFYYAATYAENDKDFKENFAAAKSETFKWTNQYLKTMEDFDRKRTECVKN